MWVRFPPPALTTNKVRAGRVIGRHGARQGNGTESLRVMLLDWLFSEVGLLTIVLSIVIAVACGWWISRGGDA